MYRPNLHILLNLLCQGGFNLQFQNTETPESLRLFVSSKKGVTLARVNVKNGRVVYFKIYKHAKEIQLIASTFFEFSNKIDKMDEKNYKAILINVLDGKPLKTFSLLGFDICFSIEKKTLTYN